MKKPLLIIDRLKKKQRCNIDKKLNFDLIDGLKKVDNLTDEEFEQRPASYGFWYSIDEGNGSMFVELLKDEETKKKCYEAINILGKLERLVDDYIIWM